MSSAEIVRILLDIIRDAQLDQIGHSVPVLDRRREVLSMQAMIEEAMNALSASSAEHERMAA